MRAKCEHKKLQLGEKHNQKVLIMELMSSQNVCSKYGLS